MGQNWRGGASKSDCLPTSNYAGGTFVYLTARGPDGPTKVGVSKTVRKRIKCLETAIGERLSLFWISVECVNAAEVEAAILTKLRKHRTIGEWLAIPFAYAVDVAKTIECRPVDFSAKDNELRVAAERVKPINMPSYPRN